MSNGSSIHFGSKSQNLEAEHKVLDEVPQSLQIENEYGPQVKLLGAPAENYIQWAANMAVALDTGVSWVMCKEEDAPEPVNSSLYHFSMFHASHHISGVPATGFKRQILLKPLQMVYVPP